MCEPVAPVMRARKVPVLRPSLSETARRRVVMLTHTTIPSFARVIRSVVIFGKSRLCAMPVAGADNSATAAAPATGIARRYESARIDTILRLA